MSDGGRIPAGVWGVWVGVATCDQADLTGGLLVGAGHHGAHRVVDDGHHVQLKLLPTHTQRVTVKPPSTFLSSRSRWCLHQGHALVWSHLLCYVSAWDPAAAFEPHKTLRWLGGLLSHTHTHIHTQGKSHSAQIKSSPTGKSGLSLSCMSNAHTRTYTLFIFISISQPLRAENVSECLEMRVHIAFYNCILSKLCVLTGLDGGQELAYALTSICSTPAETP